METFKKPVIAIDGTSAAGKGTLSKKLAAQYGFALLDTGKLYRIVGMEVLDRNINHDNEELIADIAISIVKSITPDQMSDKRLSLDVAGKMASVTGKLPKVRKVLLDYQRNFAATPPNLEENTPSKGAILDGRDIGTVIIPDADLKLFVSAETPVRAKRRTKELQSNGINVTYEAVLTDMLERDKRDAERIAAPMKPADDAIMLDTTDMSVDDVFQYVQSLIREKHDWS